MDKPRSWSMYSPHYKRPQPPEDGGWRTTFLLIFAIMGLLGAGSVLLVARTVHALDHDLATLTAPPAGTPHAGAPHRAA